MWIGLYRISTTIIAYCSCKRTIKVKPLWHKAHRSTVVSSTYGGRRTMGMTAVNNAADGRHTLRK